MPKMTNITNEDVQRAGVDSDDMIVHIQEVTDMIRKGYCDPIVDHLAYAKTFSALAMHAADLANAILVKAGMDERATKLEEMLKKQNA